jgi:alpha-galactosidase
VHDLEAPELAGGGEQVKIDFADERIEAIADRIDDEVHLIIGAFEDQFHPAIGQIFDVTHYIILLCDVLGGVPKAHALDAAAENTGFAMHDVTLHQNPAIYACRQKFSKKILLERPRIAARRDSVLLGGWQDKLPGMTQPFITFIVAISLFSLSSLSLADAPATQPAFYGWAQTPPMGWNSYDAFGDTVTEAQVMANAQYMKDKLLASGYRYIVIDFRWYDPGAMGNDYRLNVDRAGVALAADEYGRMLPAPNRFPTAAGGEGFKPLADKLHNMGLLFGFHMMRGIPRQAVAAKTQIEGSKFTAADAGDTNDKCSWCPDMFGVRANGAGQAWYDAMFRLYASWGLDFIKVDDLSGPYHKPEIEMIRRAIDKCGRPIVFSTSPGPTDPGMAAHIKANANMWRISGDFWDKWAKLDDQFDLLSHWKGVGGPGHWPDCDMIPLGHIGIHCTPAHGDHFTHFTHDEQRTLMTLWCLAPSPLMLGMNMPDNDQWTLDLITNKDVLAMDQDPLGSPAERAATFHGGREIWTRNLAGDAKAVALFNRGDKDAQISVRADDLGLSGKYHVNDVWNAKDLADFEAGPMTVSVPPHGAVLLRLAPSKAN